MRAAASFVVLILACESGATVADHLAVGTHRSCARVAQESTDDAGVVTRGPNRTLCWGEDEPQPTRETFGTLRPVESLAVGDPTCFISRFGEDAPGELYCLGNNDHGQLGNGRRESSDIAARVRFPTVDEDVLQVGVSRFGGAGFACATFGDNSDEFLQMACWGAGELGQLGVGTHRDRDRPVVIDGVVRGYSSLGAAHVCVFGGGLELLCWGSNEFGQLGTGLRRDESRPSRVAEDFTGDLPIMNYFTQVSAGARHTCAVDDAAGVWCWGANDRGQLGLGHRLDQRVPVRLVLTANEVAAGADHTCAALGESVSCWGANDRGQLGTSSRRDALLPGAETVIFPDDRIRSLQAGAGFNCALGIDGSVRCWGAGESLGTGREEDSSRPQRPFGLR